MKTTGTTETTESKMTNKTRDERRQRNDMTQGFQHNAHLTQQNLTKAKAILYVIKYNCDLRPCNTRM